MLFFHSQSGIIDILLVWTNLNILFVLGEKDEEFVYVILIKILIIVNYSNLAGL